MGDTLSAVTGRVGPLGRTLCAYCFRDFQPKQRNQNHCSPHCSDAHYNASRPVVRARQTALPGESRVERQFAEWIDTPAGQYVEAEVARRARDLKARGRRRYGIAALIEVIRYHAPVPVEGQDDFKVNNSHRSLLARRVMELNPDLAGFFETRDLRGRV